MVVGTAGTLSVGVGETSFVTVSTVAADATNLFASSLFLLLPDFCLAGGDPLLSNIEPQLGSEESREGGIELRPDDCIDVDRAGIGGTAELTTEDDSGTEVGWLGVFCL